MTPALQELAAALMPVRTGVEACISVNAVVKTVTNRTSVSVIGRVTS